MIHAPTRSSAPLGPHARMGGRHVLVLGRGVQVQALAAECAKLPGVASVRQVAEYKEGARLPDANLCIEMLGGLTMAQAAMLQALAQGMGIIITSPVLAATQGAMLAGGAAGQGVFFTNAAHGSGMVPQWLQVSGEGRLLFLTEGAAGQALRRVYQRNETPEEALRQLQLRGADLSDASGKHTHTRAAALLAAWQGIWHNPAHQPRIGLDDVRPGHLGLLRGLGLQLAFGSMVEDGSIYTGPLALPADFSLPMEGTELAAMETPQGWLRMEWPAAVGVQAAVQGAVRSYLAGTRAQHVNSQRKAVPAAPAQHATLVLGSLAHRAALVSTGKILAQEFGPHESWAGVLAQTPQREGTALEGALLLPVPMAYRTAEGSHLRLVG